MSSIFLKSLSSEWAQNILGSMSAFDNICTGISVASAVLCYVQVYILISSSTTATIVGNDSSHNMLLNFLSGDNATAIGGGRQAQGVVDLLSFFPDEVTIYPPHYASEVEGREVWALALVNMAIVSPSLITSLWGILSRFILALFRASHSRTLVGAEPSTQQHHQAAAGAGAGGEHSAKSKSKSKTGAGAGTEGIISPHQVEDGVSNVRSIGGMDAKDRFVFLVGIFMGSFYIFCMRHKTMVDSAGYVYERLIPAPSVLTGSMACSVVLSTCPLILGLHNIVVTNFRRNRQQSRVYTLAAIVMTSLGCILYTVAATYAIRGVDLQTATSNSKAYCKAAAVLLAMSAVIVAANALVCITHPFWSSRGKKGAPSLLSSLFSKGGSLRGLSLPSSPSSHNIGNSVSSSNNKKDRQQYHLWPVVLCSFLMKILSLLVPACNVATFAGGSSSSSGGLSLLSLERPALLSRFYNSDLLLSYYVLSICSSLLIVVLKQYIKGVEIRRSLDALESKRTFVRYISHEIRTPLNVVCMGLELLEEDLVNDDSGSELIPGYAECVSQLRSASGVAIDILNDLLQYDSMREDNMQIYSIQQPALEIVSETVDTFRLQARKAGVSLVLDYQPSDSGRSGGSFDHLIGAVGTSLAEYRILMQQAHVEVDKPKISQVIRNLVSNAVKFTPRGGSVTIAIRFANKMGPAFLTGDSQDALSNMAVSGLSIENSAASEEERNKAGGILGGNIFSPTSLLRSRSARASAGTAAAAAATAGVIGGGKFPSELGVGANDRNLGGIPGLTGIGSIVAAEGGEGGSPRGGSSGGGSGGSRASAAVYPGGGGGGGEGEGVGGHDIAPGPYDITSPYPTLLQKLYSRMASGAATPRAGLRAGLGPRPSVLAAALTGMHSSSGMGSRSLPSQGLSEVLVVGNNSSAAGGSFARQPSMRASFLSRASSRRRVADERIALPKYIIFEVTDTGPGIEKADIHRVFKDIVQFNPNELQGGGGSGLGLVISRGIVLAHKGGKIWLTSEGAGKGCTFAFGLPVTFVNNSGSGDASLPGRLGGGYGQMSRSVLSRFVAPLSSHIGGAFFQNGVSSSVRSRNPSNNNLAQQQEQDGPPSVYDSRRPSYVSALSMPSGIQTPPVVRLPEESRRSSAANASVVPGVALTRAALANVGDSAAREATSVHGRASIMRRRKEEAAARRRKARGEVSDGSSSQTSNRGRPPGFQLSGNMGGSSDRGDRSNSIRKAPSPPVDASSPSRGNIGLLADPNQPPAVHVVAGDAATVEAAVAAAAAMVVAADYNHSVASSNSRKSVASNRSSVSGDIMGATSHSSRRHSSFRGSADSSTHGSTHGSVVSRALRQSSRRAVQDSRAAASGDNSEGGRVPSAAALQFSGKSHKRTSKSSSQSHKDHDRKGGGGGAGWMSSEEPSPSGTPIMTPSFLMGIDASSSPSAPLSPRAQSKKNGGPSVFYGLHALVADDSSLNRHMLCRALATIGCTSTEAEDGQIAVQLVHKSLLQQFAKSRGGSQSPMYDDSRRSSLNDSRSGSASVSRRASFAGLSPATPHGLFTNTAPSPLPLTGILTGDYTPVPSATATVTSMEKEKPPPPVVSIPGGNSAGSSEAPTPEAQAQVEDTFSLPAYSPRRSADGFYFRPYDFILMDNVMPRLDGPTAASKIRELGYTGPIFGVTGNVLASDVADFVQRGANVVLGKPLKLAMLKEAIETHVIRPRRGRSHSHSRSRSRSGSAFLNIRTAMSQQVISAGTTHHHHHHHTAL